MTRTIYKTWNLMSNSEQIEFMENVRGEDLNTNFSEEELEAHSITLNDEDFEIELANLKLSAISDLNVEIQGVLGLWDGEHTIEPVRCENLKEAIYKCLNNIDDFILFEDGYGNFKIDAYHHDGTNQFVIKKLVNGKPKCMHYMKEVYGC